jgi:hypothetical protein
MARLRTEHDEPLGLLDAVRVLLRVTQRRDVDLVGLLDLASGTVTDKDGLSTPLRIGRDVSILPREEETNRHKEERTLMMTFLPSGMVERSTSTLARARTSDEALMLVRKSETVDLAPAAVTRPIDPTMK